MRIIGNNPAADNAEITAVASGTLPSGKTVVVNADGTVSVVAAVSASTGTAVSAGFAGESGLVVSNLSSTKFVAVTQSDAANSNYGTAIIGTLSGSSISFGTKQAASSIAYPENPNVVGLSDTKFVYMFVNSSSSNIAQAVVGTVSGTSISFGSTVTFAGGQTSLNAVSIATRLSDTKFVIVFRDSTDGAKAKAIVGTVSGTSVSFGSETTFASPNSSKYSVVSALSDTKVVIAWSDTPSGTRGRTIVGTVSGTSISFGSAVTYDSSAVVRHSITALSDTKFVIAYEDGGNSFYGTAIAGTISGTSITLGTPVVFLSSSLHYSSSDITNIDADNFAIVYRGETNKGEVIQGTTSGTDITFGSGIIFSAANSTSNWTTLVGDKVVIGYYQTNFTATTYSPPSTNLTAENFIGFAGGAVGVTETLSEAIGTPVVFEAGLNTYNAAAFDSNSNKVVICYNEELEDNSNLGTAIVGTVDPSNNSISFGTAVVFENAMADYISVVFDSNSNKVVISYRDLGNSAYGTAIVGTVSGTGISFGTAVVFESAGAPHISSTFDSNSNKVVISYADAGNSYVGTAIVGTVSGTNISFGTAVVFENAITTNTSTTFDSSLSKVVISYRDQANSGYGTAIVGTVSGTGISFGSATVFEAADSTTISSASGGNSKVVITYRDNGNSYYGTAIVGTVSGTSISFGTAVVFNATTTTETSCLFNSALSTFVVTYEDYASGEHGKVVVGTVSGTGISFGSASVFENANIEDLASTFDSNSNRVVLAYKDSPNSQYGTAVVVRNAGVYPVTVQVASGSNAVIDIGSAISTNQLSLTAGQQYFVQTDGTLGLTAADPSVIAGTAISATDIIVKG